MNIISTELPDLLIIEPRVFYDERGYFFESWNKADFEAAGICCNFTQDNESRSCYGVIRGLHFQTAPYTQAKLIRVLSGNILDIVVDIRKNSPTFGHHAAVELSSDNKRQLFIPRGFAHGFSVLSPEAVISYKCDNPYMPSAERGISSEDPALGIDWHLDRSSWIRSSKDLSLPPLSEIIPWEDLPCEF